jgi:hypothetical protein
MREIAHLIYHGSTKTDDPDKIRFGTGFISTHLLSRKTTVGGFVEDGREFSFELNREGTSWKQLEKSMEKTEKHFVDSLSLKMTKNQQFSAEYSYPLDSVGQQTAIAGLKTLETNIPFVLALNENLSSVVIVNEATETKWEKQTGVRVISENIKIISVESISYDQKEQYYVAVASEGSAQIAVLLRGTWPALILEPITSTPKLFYGFPLATTEDFPLPAVINSSKFIPKVARDGLLLGPATSDDNKHNKEIVEKAVDLFGQMVG